MSTFSLRRGDALEVLRTLPDNSVDSVCTDPPYGISFMGKHWDYAIPGVEVWRECLRVLKPGGHLLAFAGTRTQHRMAVNIEDAGFEIRDMIAWLYGSGFPKSLDVSKAIDKAAGAEREVVGPKCLPNGREHHFNIGFGEGDGFGSRAAGRYETAPATDAARQWQGWGTALKPALEPITIARKPFSQPTVAANVLTHGTGALNIDACRVPLQGAADAAGYANNHAVTERLPGHYDGQPLGLHDGGWKQRVGPAVVPEGRWPANVIHDGSDEVVSAFPDAGGQQGTTGKRQQGLVYGQVTEDGAGVAPRGDAGSAARFFYQGKATRKDRNAGCERIASWDHVDLGPELRSVLSQARDTFGVITPLQDACECSTTWFGKITTAPSQKDTTFIIGTVARLITELKTSNFSLSSTTRGSILGAIRMLLGSGSNPAESAESISRLIPSITDERMGSALGAAVALLRTLQPISEHARLGNVHSTVKPTDLMRYLVRLVTPPGGTSLDPFVGSGSTGKAAVLEGFKFLGIDRDADEHGEPLGYLDIARARIVHAGGVESPWPGVSFEFGVHGLDAFRAALDGLVAALAGIGVPVESTNGCMEDEL